MSSVWIEQETWREYNTHLTRYLSFLCRQAGIINSGSRSRLVLVSTIKLQRDRSQLIRKCFQALVDGFRRFVLTWWRPIIDSCLTNTALSFHVCAVTNNFVSFYYYFTVEKNRNNWSNSVVFYPLFGMIFRMCTTFINSSCAFAIAIIISIPMHIVRHHDFVTTTTTP